ncbi:mdis1-interacting receptor like kinase 2 [Quercus suber]|uniref:non-specific serine/threonine protein kinase n=1 Tax=Quercus suber TaxID=58331 RepID=A0AAW0K6P5_QUESU
MKSLNYVYLSNNSITGKIPSTICYSNQLSNHNYLTQTIPSQIGDLCSIDWIGLSYNNLTGKIPPFLKKTKVNLSYNSLEGQISDVFKNYSSDTLIGNKHLCGDIKSFPPCLSSSPNKNTSIDDKIKILVPLSFFLVLSLLGYFFISRCGVRKIESESGETKNGDIFLIWNYDGKIAYEDIIKATGDFDIRYCIRIDSYGRIYKTQLPSGKIVALKKFHHLETKEPSFDKSFKNEVKMLTEIRHRNIVKLHGYCLHKRCMFLVSEYMERGSLFSVLSNNVDAVELDWIKRMKVIKSIAHDMSYMHHECVPVIVHRDITSNNILLNFELEASISDFGMAKLLDPNSSNQTLIAGTYGYVAPKLAYTLELIVSTLPAVSIWQLRNQETHTTRESETQSGSACFSDVNHIV